MKHVFDGTQEGIDGGNYEISPINYEISPINFIISPTNFIISLINFIIDGIKQHKGVHHFGFLNNQNRVTPILSHEG